MTEWIMVVITAIYVIATIVMCMYNAQSVKVAKIQIDIMQRQFIEQTRIQLLPYFQIVKEDNPDHIDGEDFFALTSLKRNEKTIEIECFFQIVNIGHDAAKEIRYTWNVKEDSAWRSLRVASLPVNSSRTLKLMLSAQSANSYVQYYDLYINFKDLLNNEYLQKCVIAFEISDVDIKFIKIISELPELQNNVLTMRNKIDKALETFVKMLQSAGNESQQIIFVNQFVQDYCNIFYYYQQNERILKSLKKYMDKLYNLHRDVQQKASKNNEKQGNKKIRDIESDFREIYELLQKMQSDCINYKI